MGTGDDEEGLDDERPQREVTVSAFRMQRHEVTNAEYRRLVPDHEPGAADDQPAGFITWYAAYTYAAWSGARLPTEAEWEYAARAGCPFAYCTRDGLETTVDVVAWTRRSFRDPVTGEPAPRPVMRLEPNPWGLYDVLGNAWEWCEDWYGDYDKDTVTDPSGPPKGPYRVFRGGSWFDYARGVRAAYRRYYHPGYRNADLGFRLARGQAALEPGAEPPRARSATAAPPRSR